MIIRKIISKSIFRFTQFKYEIFIINNTSNIYDHSNSPSTSKIHFNKKREYTNEILNNFGPINSIIQGIDHLHTSTGLPFWAVIPLTAFTIRTVLLPLTILQIKTSKTTFSILSQSIKMSQFQDPKSQKIKLNRPLVIENFNKLKKMYNASHPGWLFISPLIQIPIFVSVIIAIRRMIREDWPGMKTGGILWFSDLTQYAFKLSDMTSDTGPIGVIFPISITLCYLLTLELSFRKGRLAANTTEQTDNRMMKLFRVFLEWLSVPMFVFSLQFPQGSLLYWLSSSVYTLSFNLLLGHPKANHALGLLPHHEISFLRAMNNFSPEILKLFFEAAQFKIQNKPEEALKIINKILSKEDKNANALYAKAQLLLEQSKFKESLEAYKLTLLYEKENFQKAKCYLGLGLTHFKLREFKESEDALLKSIVLNDNDVITWMSLCSLYANTDRRDKAKETLKIAIKLDSRCAAWEKQL